MKSSIIFGIVATIAVLGIASIAYVTSGGATITQTTTFTAFQQSISTQTLVSQDIVTIPVISFSTASQIATSNEIRYTTLTNLQTSVATETQTLLEIKTTTQVQPTNVTTTQTQTNIQIQTQMATSTTTETQTATSTYFNTTEINSLEQIISMSDTSQISTNFPIPFPNNTAWYIQGGGYFYNYAGYFQITFQSGKNIHWTFSGNGILQTSKSAMQGIVDFPIQPNTEYILTIINDNCKPVIGCGGSFTVTTSIAYIY